MTLNRMKRIVILSIAVIMAFVSGVSLRAQTPSPFSRVQSPLVAGERLASAVVDLKGESKQNATVLFYYSTNKTDVERNTSASAQAKMSAMSDGKFKCEVILPHRDHPTPNGRSDKSPKIYNRGSGTIYSKWVLKISKGGRDTYFDDAVREFTMPRVFIIAYAGDSYAAGQGAPYTSGAKWDDNLCWRSENSGGMRAIRKLIESTSDVAIRYTNVTCSGAVIGSLTSNQNVTDFFGGALGSKAPQLQQIERWMNDNNRQTVDILLMSIGGNDIGFGPTGTSLLLSGTVDLPEVKQMIETNLPGLATAYEYLDGILESTPFEISNVVLMGYPDPTIASDGKYCSPEVGGINPIDCWGAVEKRLSQSDFEFISKNFVKKLNETGALAAQTYGWEYVPISAGNHGLCNCNDGYFNTVVQALAKQGDAWGTLHPNAKGYRVMYRDAVHAKLLSTMRKHHDNLRDDAKRTAIARAKEATKQKILAKRHSVALPKFSTVATRKQLPKDLKPVSVQDDGEGSSSSRILDGGE